MQFYPKPKQLPDSLRRVAALYLLLFSLVVVPSLAKADTQLTVVNPQQNDTISSAVLFDTTGAGALKGNYLLNGSCHLADKVNITITHVVGMVVVTDVNNQPANVVGGVWEYNWVFTAGIVGTYTITATPSSNGVTPGGAAVTETVTMDATDPGLSLWLIPSSIVSHVFAGKGSSAGGTLTLGLTARYLTANATPFTETLNLNAANANTKTSTLKVANGGGTQSFNNDSAGNKSLPISFTLGNNGGLTGGLNTVTIDNGGATTYQRNLIVDFTPPVIDTTLIAKPILYPAVHTVRISGLVHDPNNGAGATLEPGGVASVTVVIQPPGGALPVENIPARLTYGSNPSDQVTWTLDYDTTGKTDGNYSIYAIIADYAGNQTIDQNAGVPYSVKIDQNHAPTAAITAPAASAYVKGSVSVTTTAAQNAGSIPLDTFELRDTIGAVTSVFASGNFPPGAQSFDSTKAADGSHTLTYHVVDQQKNSVDATQSITVDNTAPTGNFTAPAAAAVISGNAVAVSAHIVDNIAAVTNNVTWSIKDDAGHTIASGVTANTSAGGFNVAGTYDTTVGVTDGNHVLTLAATDQAGNAFSTTITVAVDNSTPAITITAPTPAANAWVHKTVAIKATISDTFNDARNIIHWEIKNGATVLASGDSSAASTINASLSWDTTATADGNQTLTFTAKNTGGNSAPVQTRIFQVDNTTPNPSVTSLTLANASTATPVAGAIATIISNTVTVNFAPGEANVDTTVSTVRVDGQPVATNWVGHTASWNTAGMGDGAHTITVFVKDLAGNFASSTPVTVVTDNTPPVVNIERPRSNTTTFVGDPLIASVADTHVSGTASITYTLAPVGMLPGQVQTVPVAVNTVTGLIITTIPGAVNGASSVNRTLTITVVGSDTAVTANTGNDTSTNVAVINSTFGLDSVVFPTQPLPGQNPDTTVSLTSTGTRPAKLFIRNKISVFGRIGIPGLDNWTLALVAGGTTPIGGNPGPGAPEITSTSLLDSPDPFDTTTITEGSYTLALNAFNAVPANIGSDTQTVIIDNTAPTASVAAIAAPFVKGIVNLTGSVTDPLDLDLLNVLSSEFVLDSAGAIAPGIQTGATPTVAWDTSTATEGKHTINLYARDAAGNLTISNTVSTTVDRTPPTAAITAPAANTIIKGTVSITASISDNVSDPLNLITYAILVDGTPLTAPSTTGSVPINATIAWNTTTVADGVHTITVTATDMAGNVATTATAKVAVDNISLKVVLSGATPANGAFLTVGSFPVAGTITDLVVGPPFAPNMVQWILSDRGASLATGSFNTSTGTVQPSSILTVTSSTPEGQHVLQVQGTNTVGTTALDTRVVMVDHTPPTINVLSPIKDQYVTTNGQAVSPVIPVKVSITDNIPSTAASGSVPAFNNMIYWTVVVQDAGGHTVFTAHDAGLYLGAALTGTYNVPSTGLGNGDYTVIVAAKDTAQNEILSTGQRFTLVNGPTSAFLAVTAPGNAFNEFGATIASPTSLNSTPSALVPNGIIYFPGAVTVKATVGNSTQMTLVDIPAQNSFNLSLRGSDTISKTVANLAYNRQGSTQVLLTGSSQATDLVNLAFAGQPASSAQLNFVIDNTQPQVFLQAPGNGYIAVPNSLLGIVFQVNKHAQSPVGNAPIQRIISGGQILNAPVINLTILDEVLQRPVPGPWSLQTAILTPNLNTANGAASVQGDAFNGFTVAWQIKIVPQQFSAGRKYRIVLSGAKDVVGNTQPGTTIGFFTVNVN